MCRWIAYSGPPIYPEDLLLLPENSLIRQSLSARYAVNPTNADGCGFGWYGERAEPGLFRDVRPAWNDENLISIARQVRTRLFFAHVRAATFGPIQRSNCHPFAHGTWLFMHNGGIGGYEVVRRRLEGMVASEYYNTRMGTTDSETFFLLLLTNGLCEAPREAFRTTVEQVEAVMAEAAVTEPLRLTAAATDGAAIYAIRYASDDRAPSLYVGNSSPSGRARADGPAVMVLSEPLDSDTSEWREVGMSRFLVAGAGGYDDSAFAVAGHRAA